MIRNQLKTKLHEDISSLFNIFKKHIKLLLNQNNFNPTNLPTKQTASPINEKIITSRGRRTTSSKKIKKIKIKEKINNTIFLN